MKRFIIIDWAGNRKFQTESFETFDDAWDYLSEYFKDLNDEEFSETVGEFAVVEKT